MSWIDDIMSATAAANGSAPDADLTKEESRPVYMGRMDGANIGVTVRGPDPTVRPRPQPKGLVGDWAKGAGPGGRGKTVSRSGRAILYEDDVRAAAEVRGLVLAWHGTDEFDRWGKKLLDLGLIDPGDETSVEILDAVWQDAVDLSARFLASGSRKKVTPWQAAELMAQGGGDRRYGSSGGAFTGSRSVTKPSVDLTDPLTAKAIMNDELSRALGRAARPEELTQFVQVLNAAENANPLVTTTNTTYDKGVDVGGSSVTSGGLTGAGRTQMVLDRAQALPEYGAFQAASTYYNALVSALDSPV